MNIDFSVVGKGCSVLKLSSADGRTISGNGAVLKARLEEAICDHQDKKIVVDMSQLLFIHSALVWALIKTVHLLHGRDVEKNTVLSYERGNVVLYVSSLDKELLTLSGHGAFFPIFDSLEEAVAFFNGEGASD